MNFWSGYKTYILGAGLLSAVIVGPRVGWTPPDEFIVSILGAMGITIRMAIGRPRSR